MTLLSQILPKIKLRKAWESIYANNPTHPELKKFKASADKNITELRKLIKNEQYKFHPYRAHLLPQPQKKKPRPLKVPPIQDRIVQKVIANVIQNKFLRLNLGCSHGYVPGRGIFTAAHEIVKLREQGYWYIVEADIVSFFDQVDRNLLFSLIERILAPDRSLLPLIQDALTVQIGNPEEFSSDQIAEYFSDADIGVPQGGILSPLFANAYLAAFDKVIVKNKLKLVRYADDFIILCKTPGEAQKALDIARKTLNELKLTIHPEGTKTRITNFKEGFRFLGIQFNGRLLTVSKKTADKFKSNISKRTNVSDTPDFIHSLFVLRRVIESWGRTYSFCHAENLKINNQFTLKQYGELDNFIKSKVADYLEKCDFVPKNKKFEGIHFKRLEVPQLVGILQTAETLEQLSTRLKERHKRYKKNRNSSKKVSQNS